MVPALALVLAGALSQLADQVIATAPARGALSIEVGGPGRLGETLERVVVGRLREGGRIVNAGAADFELACSTDVRGEKVGLECTILATSGKIWRKVAGNSATSAIGSRFFEIPSDPELRNLLGPAPLPAGPHKPTWNVRVLPLDKITGADPVLSIAMDQARGASLVLLTERELVVWEKPLGAGAPSIRRYPHTMRAAAQIPRTPLGTLVLDSHMANYRVWSRAEGSVGMTGSRFPLGVDPSGNLLLGDLDPQRGAFQIGAPWPSKLRGVATTRIGGSWFGASVDESARLLVYRGSPGSLFFAAEGAGDAVALWDADGDGLPEVATSAPTLPGEGDQIVVRNARGEVWHSAETTGAITALATGDFDGKGQMELIAAVLYRQTGKAELWIIE
jgi:hypothetical protein